ncbi:RpiB/LacA/LacB family sugar-phosphate isomerase [Candidatus Collierbacteria bacterium]|nr:RpiB/LacA/LacB family sugar-phosphate isomerase [Candidatus Collierbacteria bacterium]
MKLVLGADHGGFKLKEAVKSWLINSAYSVVDVGALKLEKEDDFVDYATLAAVEVANDEQAMGILFCRNGLGMMIAANRFPKIRCGVGFDGGAVERGRSDDDINCLAVPADYLSEKEAKKMIEIFLRTKFSGKEKYKRRLIKIENLGSDLSGRGCCGGGHCHRDLPD